MWVTASCLHGDQQQVTEARRLPGSPPFASDGCAAASRLGWFISQVLAEVPWKPLDVPTCEVEEGHTAARERRLRLGAAFPPSWPIS